MAGDELSSSQPYISSQIGVPMKLNTWIPLPIGHAGFYLPFGYACKSPFRYKGLSNAETTAAQATLGKSLRAMM